MTLSNNRRLWGTLCLLALATNLACSLLARPLTGESAQIQPTRTPLPTFTPTAETQTLVIPPTATPAPLLTEPPPDPSPTDTPIPATQPTAEPAVAPLEEEPVAETAPAVGTDATEAEAPAPVPAPTEPPPPPAQSDAPAEPGVGAHGVIGKISFREGRNTYGVGEKVFVKIEATNTQPGQLAFGILGLTTDRGFQTSWSSGTIDGTFTHEDGLPFNAPGTHKLWLSICFSTEDVCKGPDGDWERFEPGLDVVVQ